MDGVLIGREGREEFGHTQKYEIIRTLYISNRIYAGVYTIQQIRRRPRLRGQ
jgi:hypothetical protein